MVLKYRNKEISSLGDIQNLTAKDLRENLRSNSEPTGGVKADLVLKVYALLIRDMLPLNANNMGNEDDSLQDQGDFKYEATIRRIPALGWSTDLGHLPEMNFLQLNDYLVVSMRKCHHIFHKGTHCKKLKSYQFFFTRNVKKLTSKVFENKAYVRATVLPSMTKMPYRMVVEFAPTCDVSQDACTCPAGLGMQGKGKCNHIAIEDFTTREFRTNPEPLTCTS